MAPFQMPWSTFSAFLVLKGAVVLAVAWALIDRAREQRADAKEGRR